MERIVKYWYPRGMARPREFDEAAVLDAAREQFWLKGYAATSMDAIAAATGLGKGSLYGAFGGKQQLFLRIFDGYCARLTDAVTSGLTGPDEQAYVRLCAHIRATAAAVAADSRHRGCLLAKSVAELSEHDPEITVRSRRTLDGIAVTLADDIRAAQRHRDLDPAADADRLALLVVAVLRGIEALGKAGIGADLVEGVAETAIALLPRVDTTREADEAPCPDAMARNATHP
ncbi:TetR/AcrR family transcriptional regulator [Brachybacterium sp. FME24]|uniref:TetR/AcrR family transcriptional regulator n=1 Tax=Brachybacterium sp. FME24 TaxID=2742605 RepID=UPI001D0288FA|nr:TetR/AcrR family transcriptional regulator [Brachybacterium sp. FME24]